jgi:hypothetical protein
VQILPRRQHRVSFRLRQEPGHQRVERALPELLGRQVEVGIAFLRMRDGEQHGEQRDNFLEC